MRTLYGDHADNITNPSACNFPDCNRAKSVKGLKADPGRAKVARSNLEMVTGDYSSRSHVDDRRSPGMSFHNSRDVCLEVSGPKRNTEANEDEADCEAAEHNKLYRPSPANVFRPPEIPFCFSEPSKGA